MEVRLLSALSSNYVTAMESNRVSHKYEMARQTSESIELSKKLPNYLASKENGFTARLRVE